MHEHPQLSLFDAEMKRLNSELLPVDEAPRCISKAELNPFIEEAHFSCLHLESHYFTHDPYLMHVGEGWNQ